MTFSQNVKKLRKAKNLTQEQLAEMLGVSAQAVSKWETSETYPDCSLLAPLSAALGTSIDTLFGNSACSMEDVSKRVISLLDSTPTEQRFHVARDICWQVEKGLFNASMKIDTTYSPDEINTRTQTSFIIEDQGFTLVSNGESPFFSIFPEYDDSYTKAIGDGEEMRKIFEHLSSPDTMRAALFLHTKMCNYAFEAEVLADACDIKEERLEKVLQDLLDLRLLNKRDLEIDGNPTTLYFAFTTVKFIALLLMAKEFNYTGANALTTINRQKTALK